MSAKRIAKKVIGPILAALLFGLQLHFCGPTFQYSDGRTCDTCPTLSHGQIERPNEAGVLVAHGDCHDCCVLTVCHSDSQTEFDSANQASGSDIVDMPRVAELAPVIETSSGSRTMPLFEGCPATGPPGETPSRAPPLFQLA